MLDFNEPFAGSRFVVTGGAGFIGRHLSRALVAAGARVTVLDDLSNSTDANLPAEVELVKACVTDRDTVAQVMANAQGCFHLAAVASVAECEADWSRANRVNAGGTVAVLNSARPTAERGAIPVVFASSAAVYGDQGSLPVTEDAEARPQSVYGADKLASEISGATAARSFGVPFTALRFFNVYGPGQDASSPYSGVISKFVDLALKGQRLTVFGDGKQTRDFVYVGDLVQHLLAAMRTSEARPRILNVCSGKETSIAELAQMISDLSGSMGGVIHAAPRSFEISRSLGDNSSARAAMGVSANHSLSVGLLELIRYSRDPRFASVTVAQSRTSSNTPC